MLYVPDARRIEGEEFRDFGTFKYLDVWMQPSCVLIFDDQLKPGKPLAKSASLMITN